MTCVKTNIISLIVILLPLNIIEAQTDCNIYYENHFFILDFEEIKYDISEVEEYLFTTFPHNDPTSGDVVYDRVKWMNDEMVILSEYDGLYGFLKYRTDGSGFDSFRFTSKPYYNLNDQVHKILFVFKGSIPSAKGLWPAWWLNGSREDEWLYEYHNTSVTDRSLDEFSGKGEFHNTPSPVNATDWPSAGEIDIIENINGSSKIYNTLHTCPQMCEAEWNHSGEKINCANATATDPNSGCSGESYEINSPEGTFACLWEDNALSFYYWEAGSDIRAPGGPLSGFPNPESWDDSALTNYVKLFNTDLQCDDELHKDWQCINCKEKNRCEFVNLKMILNATLCGKWAGNEFDESENPLENCKEYILNDGREEIENSYLKIEYLAVRKL